MEEWTGVQLLLAVEIRKTTREVICCSKSRHKKNKSGKVVSQVRLVISNSRFYSEQHFAVDCQECKLPFGESFAKINHVETYLCTGQCNTYNNVRNVLRKKSYKIIRKDRSYS